MWPRECRQETHRPGLLSHVTAGSGTRRPLPGSLTLLLKGSNQDYQEINGLFATKFQNTALNAGLHSLFPQKMGSTEDHQMRKRQRTPTTRYWDGHAEVHMDSINQAEPADVNFGIYQILTPQRPCFWSRPQSEIWFGNTANMAWLFVTIPT